MVEIPAESTLIHENPSIPNAGDNGALLEWAMACKANTKKYKTQMEALRGMD